MTYSCTDFADSIIDALGVNVPDESNDSPSDQADLCLARIEMLWRAHQELVELCASILEHYDGNEQDLDVAVGVISERFGLKQEIADARAEHHDTIEEAGL